MHTLILTCAGKSTRYPGYRPKWSLTHPNGRMMAAESLIGIRGADRIIAAFNEHDIATFGEEAIYDEFEVGLKGPEFIVCDVGDSPSHVETIRRVIDRFAVRGNFTAKDCDNRFSLDLPFERNTVAVASLMHVGRVDASNKGFVKMNLADCRLEDIRERTLLSELFCCGAYTFKDAEEFFKESQVYRRVSDYIRSRVSDFYAVEAHDYVDWGTAEEWVSYIGQYKTLFVDIDGVLVESSHRSFEPVWGTTPLIQANVDYLNRLHATGKVEIILTTSRPESYRQVTEQQLKGLHFDRMIMGLRNCGRYLVNDYVSKRGGHTCFAVNIERDSGLIEQALRRG